MVRTAGLLDLGDHLIGHRRSGAGAVAGTAQVVDHDAGTLAGERQGVLTTQPTTGSGDDDDAVLHSGHGVPFVEQMIGFLSGRAPTLEEFARQLPRLLCIRRIDHGR